MIQLQNPVHKAVGQTGSLSVVEFALMPLQCVGGVVCGFETV